MSKAEVKDRAHATVGPVAQGIHDRSVVVDGHIDTLLELVNGKVTGIGEPNNVIHVDLPRMKKGGVNVQLFAAFIEPAYKPERALKRSLQLVSRMLKEIEGNQEEIALALSFNDIEKINAKGKIAAIISIEGGEAISGDLEVLYALYKLGVRSIGLTWNERNDIAEGVGEKHAHGGLTSFGHDVVKEMNRLGMVVDVSHMTEKSFWGVIEASEKPIIASHSNAYSVCAHLRNLKDDQIKALAQNGGVMGMNFAPPFIAKENANIDKLIAHIDHIAGLVGTDHIGLGSDYDGIPSTPEGLEDISTLPRITQALLDKGYEELDIKKILGGNFMRVLRDIL
jgi:membrane dipeptidase